MGIAGAIRFAAFRALCPSENAKPTSQCNALLIDCFKGDRPFPVVDPNLLPDDRPQIPFRERDRQLAIIDRDVGETRNFAPGVSSYGCRQSRFEPTIKIYLLGRRKRVGG